MFNPVTVSAGAGSTNLVISFQNDIQTVTNGSSLALLDLSACVEEQGVTPIEHFVTKSISAVDLNDDRDYSVKIYKLVINELNGGLFDPCSLGDNSVIWSGTVTRPSDDTKSVAISITGSEFAPVVTLEEVVNTASVANVLGSGVTAGWSNWEVNGQGLTPISMQSFNGRLYQAVRGTDNNIYTRSSVDGFDWSVWVLNGQTLNEITMESFGGELYQAVRGTDGLIYTRKTSDGSIWSNWIANGATPGTVSMVRNGEILVQAVRGTDNNIYTRSKGLLSDWSNWSANGQTLNNVKMVSYNNAVYQSVVGTDNLVYLRHNTTPFYSTDWSLWEPVLDSSKDPIRTVSTSVELTISNNNLYVATTNAQSRPLLARLSSPLINAQSISTVSLNEVAKFNSLISVDEYYKYQTPPGNINNFTLQTIVNPANGNISYRTAYGTNTEANLWSGWFNGGATKFQPSNFVFNGGVIQTVVGTDGNIYTRNYGFFAVG